MSDTKVVCETCGPLKAEFIHHLKFDCDSDLAESVKAGVIWYGNPDLLEQGQIDPLLWPAIQKINSTGWVWTAESCQGHPDATEDEAWGHNVEPMLRLVCRSEYAGDMLYCLAKAMWNPGDPGKGIMSRQLGFKVWPRELDIPNSTNEYAEDWFEVLVYVQARNVFERNEGVKAYERFADLLISNPQV